MNSAVYNEIGKTYNDTRKADPYIANRLYSLLQPENEVSYLDIGCGTGNYLAVMLKKGVRMFGMDPSDTMLKSAKEKNLKTTLIRGSAESIPFPDADFGGAIAVLTHHHWTNLHQSLGELHRVIRKEGRLIFFTYKRDQLNNYWLKEYFPRMISQAINQITDYENMFELLEKTGWRINTEEKYFVRDDLQDHFMYCYSMFGTGHQDSDWLMIS